MWYFGSPHWVFCYFEKGDQHWILIEIMLKHEIELVDRLVPINGVRGIDLSQVLNLSFFLSLWGLFYVVQHGLFEGSCDCRDAFFISKSEHGAFFIWIDNLYCWRVVQLKEEFLLEINSLLSPIFNNLIKNSLFPIHCCPASSSIPIESKRLTKLFWADRRFMGERGTSELFHF